ncbi:TolC family protein [Sphingobacterium sp. UBA7631]|nr:TolC family protein [Sphingobacterium sp. UBA7631]
MTMEKNREIKLSKAYLSRAESVVQDKKNNRLPTASFAASAGYLTDVGVLGLGTMATGFYPMPHFSNSYAMQASVYLYTGGRLTADINIAELERELAALNIQKNSQSVKLIIAGYYLDLYQLYQQKKVYEKNIVLGKELLEKINSRYQTGIALKSDRIRNELLVSTFELALANLKEHITIANNNIV